MTLHGLKKCGVDENSSLLFLSSLLFHLFFSSLRFCVTCSVLCCVVLLCVIVFCFVLFCFVLFCFVLFCFVLFCFVLFCFVLFCFVLFCFVLFCFVLFCLLLLFLTGLHEDTMWYGHPDDTMRCNPASETNLPEPSLCTDPSLTLLMQS